MLSPRAVRSGNVKIGEDADTLQNMTLAQLLEQCSLTSEEKKHKKEEDKQKKEDEKKQREKEKAKAKAKNESDDKAKKAKQKNEEAEESEEGKKKKLKRWREGWLTKEGGVHRNWKRRWCVLAGEMVYYFKDNLPTSPLAGVIRLQENSVIAAADEAKKKHCFEVVVLGRTFLIQASDDQDRDGWIAELQKAVERRKKLTEKERKQERQRKERERREKEQQLKIAATPGSSNSGGVPFFSKLRKQAKESGESDEKKDKAKEKEEKEREKEKEKQEKEKEKAKEKEEKAKEKEKEKQDKEKEKEEKAKEKEKEKKEKELAKKSKDVL